MTEPFRGAPVVESTDDVLAVQPEFVRESTDAPVRDAIVAAELALFDEAGIAGDYASAQASVLTATGTYLEGLGADRSVFRQPGEATETYRARILVFPDTATPTAILDAANACLAPYSATAAKYWEQLDGCFMDDGTGGRSSFMYSGSQPRSPLYVDRLYADDSTANGGAVCTGRDPGGCRMNSDPYGRWFELRVPDLAPIDDSAAGMSSTASDLVTGWYMGDGSDPVNTNYMQSSSASAADVYAAIITAVNRIKGHGVRFQMYVDPQL